MILLDAYAMLALALGERAADDVEQATRARDVGMSAVNVFETTDRLIRRYGWSQREASERFGPLLEQHIDVVSVDADIAWRGAVLRARYYDRRACALSLADSILLASTEHADAVATSDPAIAAVARAEGIEVVALPDSSGQRP